MAADNTEDCQGSKVGQFYEDKTVFITGATGFMGKVWRRMTILNFLLTIPCKVLVEKLLRSTQVKKIYLLIRPKKGLQTKVRLEELLSAKIFDKIKESYPDYLSRVEAISGDITEPLFGLSQEDLQ